MAEPSTSPVEQPLETQLAELLHDLSDVQSDLLSVLSEKRQRMADSDFEGMQQIEQREPKTPSSVCRITFSFN